MCIYIDIYITFLFPLGDDKKQSFGEGDLRYNNKLLLNICNLYIYIYIYITFLFPLGDDKKQSLGEGDLREVLKIVRRIGLK